LLIKRGQALQVYLTKKWLEHRQFSQATAKQSHIKDATLAPQEQAAAEEEGKATAMIFALLQEQHKNQMETMVAANQKAVDSMMEKMNAIIFSRTKPANKENTLPTASNAGSGTGGTKRTKKKCPHCVKHVSNRSADCYELEANTGKWWAGWKFMNYTRETPI
jgi:hypothetical protein